MKVVILEDSREQSDWQIEEFQRSRLGADIMLFSSEQEFRDAIPSLKNSPPDIFVLDVMVRWTKPSSHPIEPPEDVVKEGYYRSGVRCTELLRKAGIYSPVILYTILEEADIKDDLQRLREADERIYYVQKKLYYLTKDERLDPLLSQIRAITSGQV